MSKRFLFGLLSFTSCMILEAFCGAADWKQNKVFGIKGAVYKDGQLLTTLPDRVFDLSGTNNKESRLNHLLSYHQENADSTHVDLSNTDPDHVHIEHDDDDEDGTSRKISVMVKSCCVETICVSVPMSEECTNENFLKYRNKAKGLDRTKSMNQLGQKLGAALSSDEDGGLFSQPQKSKFGQSPIYDKEPSYDRTSSFDRTPGYDQKPSYSQSPSFSGDSILSPYRRQTSISDDSIPFKKQPSFGRNFGGNNDHTDYPGTKPEPNRYSGLRGLGNFGSFGNLGSIFGGNDLFNEPDMESLSTPTPKDESIPTYPSQEPYNVPANEARTIINDVYKTTNELRRRHGQPEMTVNQNLENLAQDWANNIGRSGVMRHRTSKFGENIAKLPEVKNIGEVSAREWYLEMRFSNPHETENELRSNRKALHMTQLLWKSSRQMGCGVSKDTGDYYFVVCNYNPAGNESPNYRKNVPDLSEVDIKRATDEKTELDKKIKADMMEKLQNKMKNMQFDRSFRFSPRRI